MKIYTKTGDKGTTSLVGKRVDKDHLRVEAYGTIDELNSIIGYAMTYLDSNETNNLYGELQRIQHELFDCGGDLAIVKDGIPFKTTNKMIEDLELKIDEFMESTPPLKRFILPGGSKAAAVIHQARAVARRAERCVVSLMKDENIHEPVLMYLNRLSDYLFALARVINVIADVKDIEYERGAIVFRTSQKEE
ncbi:cob(I)yrinic acid a,c-diamide adenosyltransferase [Bacillus sp. RG28]|uniref:Corrinoid adenosyltransferase n=1 Tax=Gottfriedia endophytica TaxID=2820819 RepID=A0A940SIW0_9BACI|nr:cob(I)yrinic acid a,c-diamide adenosyltransferase [Gottfriedia endophytica]MBP0724249.1 cob(I)yrinic acid a,c-diamide adenosyltransferase [Gottfriedia endophytica]